MAEHLGPGRYAPPKVSGIAITERWGIQIGVKSVPRMLSGTTNDPLPGSPFYETYKCLQPQTTKPEAAVALWFAYYNFCHVHGSLRVTPGMQAGLTDRVWSLNELTV